MKPIDLNPIHTLILYILWSILIFSVVLILPLRKWTDCFPLVSSRLRVSYNFGPLFVSLIGTKNFLNAKEFSPTDRNIPPGLCLNIGIQFLSECWFILFSFVYDKSRQLRDVKSQTRGDREFASRKYPRDKASANDKDVVATQRPVSPLCTGKLPSLVFRALAADDTKPSCIP